MNVVDFIRKKMETNLAMLFLQYSKAVGGDMYRVSFRKESNNRVFFAGTRKGGAPKIYTQDDIPILLIKKMAEIGTEHCYITSYSKTHHLILLDDTSPEKLKQIKNDGYRIAFQQQTSPHSWQAILRIRRINRVEHPQLETKQQSIEYLASLKLAQKLNDCFGDPNLVNAVQAHRFPGTPNPKKKYRLNDALPCPIVRIVDAGGEECTYSQNLLIEIMKELELKGSGDKPSHHRSTQKDPSLLIDPHQDPAIPIFLSKIYLAHQRDIERLSGSGTDDFSKLDFMIAVRLRATRHSIDEVKQIIETCTPKIGRRHVWKDYAYRTAEVAFGQKGSSIIERYRKFITTWVKIEKL